MNPVHQRFLVENVDVKPYWLRSIHLEQFSLNIALHILVIAICIFMPLTALSNESPNITIPATNLCIEGNAYYFYYAEDGSIAVKINGRFRLNTDNLKWRIKYIDDTNNTETEAVYDGFYVYSIARNLPHAHMPGGTNAFISGDSSSTNKFPSSRSDEEVAVVSTHQQPSSLFDSAEVAWMSLVACNLISNPPVNLTPPWPLTGIEAMAYRSRIVKPDPEWNCCSDIEFITSEKIWSSALEAAKLEPPLMTERINAPNEDFIEARFRVLSWTNAIYSCIPLEAEFKRFWFSNISTGDNVRSVIRIIASNYFVSSEPIVTPQISKKTYITDTRFHTPEASNFPIYYAVTSNTWLGDQDPHLAQLIEVNRTNYHRMQELNRKQFQMPAFSRRIAFISLIFLLCMAPIAFYYYKKIKSASIPKRRRF